MGPCSCLCAETADSSGSALLTGNETAKYSTALPLQPLFGDQNELSVQPLQQSLGHRDIPEQDGARGTG